MGVKEGNKNAMKYHKEYEWYDKQPEPKASKVQFITRVIRYGYSYEEAIAPGKIVFKPKPKGYVDDNGRECNKCGIYKTRDLFSKSKPGIHGRTSICLECRNKRKREYRDKTNRKADREYKEKRRHLSIGQQVYFNNEVREVIDYTFKKSYTVRSLFSGEIRKFCSCDNWSRRNEVNTNSVRSFKVLTDNIELKEKEEVVEVEEAPKFKLSLEDMFEEDYYN